MTTTLTFYINPMSKVPAIAHNGEVVTEASAICAYLADAFPQAKLAPPTTNRAAYYRWLFFAAGPVEAAITNRALGFEVSADRGRAAGYGSYDRAIDTLEKAVSCDTWLCGDQFTAADVYVGSQVDWGLRFKSIPTRLRERPAYQRAKAIDAELIAKAQAKTA
jgi:glutathione S-transferase